MDTTYKLHKLFLIKGLFVEYLLTQHSGFILY